MSAPITNSVNLAKLRDCIERGYNRPSALDEALALLDSNDENEEEHTENCDCCQAFLKMEKRYDHLRGFPQDEEEFTHDKK